MKFAAMLSGAAMVVAWSHPASGQTPTVPVAIGKRCEVAPLTRPDPSEPAKSVPTKPTLALTRSFQSGDWAAFRKDVIEIRGLINANAECFKPASEDPPHDTIGKDDYMVVSWVGTTALGDAALLSAVVHAARNEGYVSRLPGLTAGKSPKLYQVFISDDRQDVMASVFMSTREQNPLLKQIPEVAEKILDPMLGLLSATLGTEPPSLTRTPNGGWATMSEVRLPYERAAVKVEMRAQLAPLAGLKSASTKLKSTLTLIDVRYSKEGKALAGELDTIMQNKAADCVAATGPNACLQLVDPDFTARYDARCGGNCSGDLEKALQTVDGKFRALAAAGVREKLDAKAELRNVPLTRYSFGLMTGFSFWRKSSDPRVEVDDGVLEHDPLDRTITMVTFNGAFTPYDADAFSITRAERHRWFVGAVITPSFGAGVGYTWLPTRGLGINVGYAVLGISVADGGKQIGEKPADSADPFKLGVTGAAFVGGSYNFK